MVILTMLTFGIRSGGDGMAEFGEAQPNSFYYELMARGEYEAAGRYLQFLQGGISDTRRYTVDNFRMTKLKRRLIRCIGEIRPPVTLEKIERRMGRRKRRSLDASIEALVIYGYVDEIDNKFSLTQKGKDVDPTGLIERIWHVILRENRPLTVPEISKRLPKEYPSSIRSSLCEMVDQGMAIKPQRGQFFINKQHEPQLRNQNQH